jgi:hypothetical protein
LGGGVDVGGNTNGRACVISLCRRVTSALGSSS